MVDYIVWFLNIEPALQPWNKLHLFMVYIYINIYLYISEFYLQIFDKDFSSVFMEGISCSGL